MAGLDFRAIAERLSCEEFAHSQLKMNRYGRAQCPFHPGATHYNLRFFPDGRCFCHVCHKSGDVVTLAAATWNTTQLEAARQLNSMFNLGVEAGGGPNRTIIERRKAEKERHEQQQRQQAARFISNLPNILDAIDDFKQARHELAKFSINELDTDAGTAALARCVSAKIHVDELWHWMTSDNPGEDMNVSNKQAVIY